MDFSAPDCETGSIISSACGSTATPSVSARGAESSAGGYSACSDSGAGGSLLVNAGGPSEGADGLSGDEGVDEAADEEKAERRPLLKRRPPPGARKGGSAEDAAQAKACEGDGIGLALLSKHFGWKLLVLLFATQHVTKGFVPSFVMPNVPYVYKDYHVGGPQVQIFASIITLPWPMKPIIGLISDAFPIFGYNKAPYISLSILCGVFACATIGLMPHDQLGVQTFVICLLLFQFHISCTDLLTEARYAERMKERPAQGPSMLSFVWFGIFLGQLAGTALVGPTMSLFGHKTPFLIAVVPLAAALIPVLFNYAEEKPRSSAQRAAMWRRLGDQKEVCFLCVLMFIGTILLLVLGLVVDDTLTMAIAGVVVTVVMAVAVSVILSPIIAKVCLFLLIQTSVGLDYSGAAFYFYTDTVTEYPDGPHFSQEFYTTALGLLRLVCAIVGVATYQWYMTEWSYRSIFFATNVAGAILGASDVIFFLRLNITWGMPDAAFAMGSSVLYDVVVQWMWMPAVVIMAQLCPRGMEAILLSLLAACHNLGNSVASITGALALEWYGCQPSGQENEGDEFKNLWVVSAISCVLPIVPILVIPWLVPDVKQTEPLMAENERDATRGSPLRRWQGRD